MEKKNFIASNLSPKAPAPRAGSEARTDRESGADLAAPRTEEEADQAVRRLRWFGFGAAEFSSFRPDDPTLEGSFSSVSRQIFATKY